MSEADGDYGSEGDYGSDGDSEGDEGTVGAIWSRRKRRPPPRPAPRRIPPPMVAQQPTWRPARLRSFMGMGFAVFGPAVTADQVLQVEPQESFEGRRLIVDTTVAGGTSAGLVLLRRIDIGTQPQSPSVSAPAPAAMFSAVATGAGLDLQIAFRATQVQVTLGITAAPGAGVTVTSAVGFYGNWIR